MSTIGSRISVVSGILTTKSVSSETNTLHKKKSHSIMSTTKLLDESEASERYDSRLSETEKENCLNTSRTCSAIVGFCVGIFIQGSSLALNFILSYLGDEPVSLKTYTIATMVWSSLSGILGVSIMLLMRSMVVTTFYSTNSTKDGALLEEKEDFMCGVIHNLEKFFSIGAVGGVAFAWAATDLILDVKVHVLESSLVFLVAILFYCFSSKESI